MKIPRPCLGLILLCPAIAFAIPANPGPVWVPNPAWPRHPAEFAWAAVPSIAVDSHDNVWVYVRTNPVVRVYSPDGALLRTWREENPRTRPHAIRFDRDGNVWLVDNTLAVARKFSPDGRTVLLTLGTLGVPGQDSQHFNGPTDVAFGPNGDIYVSDGYGNSRVVHFDPSGRFVNAWGRRGPGPGEFNCPHSIVADSRGHIYVADRSNGRVQVFDPSGRLLSIWSNLVVPWGLWVTPGDEIWVCGSSADGWRPDQGYLGAPPKDQTFMKFNTDGKMLQLWTVPIGSVEPGAMNWVHGMAVDSHGNIYAGDIMGHRVQKYVRR